MAADETPTDTDPPGSDITQDSDVTPSPVPEPVADKTDTETAAPVETPVPDTLPAPLPPDPPVPEPEAGAGAEAEKPPASVQEPAPDAEAEADSRPAPEITPEALAEGEKISADDPVPGPPPEVPPEPSEVSSSHKAPMPGELMPGEPMPEGPVPKELMPGEPKAGEPKAEEPVPTEPVLEPPLDPAAAALPEFAALGLTPEVLKAVAEVGYKTPTPIQAQAIPQVLRGRDVLGCAQTGTGKTAGFTLPMIQILAEGRSRARIPRCLILEPTRELAAQVAENFELYRKYNRLSMALLIGGVSFGDQLSLLDRGVDVLIATPGRLLDHCERGRVLLTGVQVLVIDEADRMLDMGFIPDVERIVSMLPVFRQTLFFSATMAPEIRKIADAFLRDPKEITVSPPASPAETVEQRVLIVGERDKRRTLRRLLRNEPVTNALVFCNRKRDVSIVSRSLVRHGFAAGALHGDMDQIARMETLERFRNGEIAVLVASDVAARGLDIAGLSHVFNFDVPNNPEDYVHRIGRTGRAGRNGVAFTIATAPEVKALAAVETLIDRSLPRVETTENERENDAGEEGDRRARPKRRGGRGSRREDRGGDPGRSSRSADVRTGELRAGESRAGESRASESRASESRGGEGSRSRRRSAGRLEEDGPDRPVMGMGNHIPAFLLIDPLKSRRARGWEDGDEDESEEEGAEKNESIREDMHGRTSDAGSGPSASSQERRNSAATAADGNEDEAAPPTLRRARTAKGGDSRRHRRRPNGPPSSSSSAPPPPPPPLSSPSSKSSATASAPETEPGDPNAAPLPVAPMAEKPVDAAPPPTPLQEAKPEDVAPERPETERPETEGSEKEQPEVPPPADARGPETAQSEPVEEQAPTRQPLDIEKATDESVEAPATQVEPEKLT